MTKSTKLRSDRAKLQAMLMTCPCDDCPLELTDCVYCKSCKAFDLWQADVDKLTERIQLREMSDC